MKKTEERKAWDRYINACKAEDRQMQIWFALSLADTVANAKAHKTWLKRHATAKRNYAAWQAEREQFQFVGFNPYFAGTK